MRTLSRVIGGCGACAALAVPAAADVPQVLDRVPGGAAMVLVVDDVGAFHEKASGIVEKLEMPQAQMPLGMVGSLLQSPGLNAGGEMAVAFMAGEDGTLNMEAETPPMIMLLPVSSYEDLGSTFSASDHEGELDAVQFMGQSAYMRDIGGGWAALSPDEQLLSGFAGEGGQLEAHETRLGAAGSEMADSTDAMLAINVQTLAPMIRTGIEQMSSQMEAMADMMGEQSRGMKEMASLLSSLSDEFIRDGRSALVGLGIGEAGITLDLGAHFKPGSELAGMLDAEGDALSLLDHVPGSPFIAAMAMDTSSPAMKRMLTRMGELSKEMNPQQSDMMGMFNMAEMIDKQDGMAFVMGNPPAIMGGGLFSNTLQFTRCGNAEQTVGKMGEMLEEMDGQTQQGVTFSTSFDKGATEVEGISIDRWGMKMQFDQSEPSAQQAQMGMSMIFGPSGGPNGYYAALDNGMITTFSQNTPLMSEAIKAAREGGGLGSSQDVSAAAAHLPDRCAIQVFLGTDSIVQQAQSVAAMMGGGANFDPPDELAPIAGGLAMKNSGAIARLYVPNNVLDLARKLQEMGKDAGQQGEPAPREEEGKPRF